MDPKIDPKTARSDSMSSTASSPVSPTTSNTYTNNINRRGSGTMFASLHELKRPNDPRLQARRQSIHDQRPAPGVFGKMWNSWVRGV